MTPTFRISLTLCNKSLIAVDYQLEVSWIGLKTNTSTVLLHLSSDVAFHTAAASTPQTSHRDWSTLCADMEFNLNQCRQPQRRSGLPVASKLYASGPSATFMSSPVSRWAAVLSSFSSSIFPKRSKDKSNCKNRAGVALELERERVIATFCKRFESSKKPQKVHNLPCKMLQFHFKSRLNQARR